MKEGEEMITYGEFKKLFDVIPGEPEFELYFDHTENTYTIIKYDDRVTFQRCGYMTGSGEAEYNSLADLYAANLMDGICLQEDWKHITDIVIDATFSVLSDIEDLLSSYNLEVWNKCRFA